MKAVINPRTGVWKELSDETYKSDKELLEADGFRLMNEKEIKRYLKGQPKKKEVKQDKINIPNEKK